MTLGAVDRPGGEVAMPTGGSTAGAKAPPVGAPTLDQLLAEPIVQHLMRRDRTNPASIRRLLRGTAAARITGRPKCATARSDHPPLAAPAVSCLPPHIAHRFLKLVATFPPCLRCSFARGSPVAPGAGTCSSARVRSRRRSGSSSPPGATSDILCSEAERLRQAGANLCENPVTEGPTGRNVLRL